MNDKTPLSKLTRASIRKTGRLNRETDSPGKSLGRVITNRSQEGNYLWLYGEHVVNSLPLLETPCFATAIAKFTTFQIRINHSHLVLVGFRPTEKLIHISICKTQLQCCHHPKDISVLEGRHQYMGHMSRQTFEFRPKSRRTPSEVWKKAEKTPSDQAREILTTRAFAVLVNV